MKKICVILVNYNGKKYNDTCIASVLGSTVSDRIQIVVVDNGSTDDSLSLLRDKWGRNGQVTILPLGRNYGLSKANNAGMEWAEKRGAEYVLLLNNDTEIAADAIEKMVDIQRKTGAVVVPKIIFADRPDVIWCAGGCFSRVIRKPIQRGLNQKDTGQFDQSEQCAFANGCCMLLSREIWRKLGPMDERFFLYYEDTEYSMRAERKKIPIWYCADAVVYHKVNGSTLGNERPDGAYYITRNWLLCNRRYMKGRFLLFLFYFFLNRGAWCMIWFLTGKKQNATAAAEGIADYQRGVTGQYRKNSL